MDLFSLSDVLELNQNFDLVCRQSVLIWSLCISPLAPVFCVLICASLSPAVKEDKLLQKLMNCMVKFFGIDSDSALSKMERQGSIFLAFLTTLWRHIMYLVFNHLSHSSCHKLNFIYPALSRAVECS